MIKIINKIINSKITKIILISIFYLITLASLGYSIIESTGTIVNIGKVSFIVFALLFASLKFKKVYKFALMSIPICLVIIQMTFTTYNKIFEEFTTYNWNKYPQIRSYLVESLNTKYGVIGKSEYFIIELLGEPKKKFSSFEYPKQNNFIVYKYYIGADVNFMYLNIVFKDGISVKSYKTYEWDYWDKY